MTTTVEYLQALAEKHEETARAIRLTLAELNGHLVAKKQKKGIGAVIDQAIAVRAAAGAAHSNGSSRSSWSPERRAKFQQTMQKKYAGARKKKRGGLSWYQLRQAARVESLRLLSAFDPTEPRTPRAAGLDPIEGKKIGTLVHNGYLKAKGDGLIRTNKAFVP